LCFGFAQFRCGSVQKSVLIRRLDHFDSLRTQLLDQFEDIYFLFLLHPLNYDVKGDESSGSTNSRAKTMKCYDKMNLSDYNYANLQ
jgi:hypothetical protein